MTHAPGMWLSLHSAWGLSLPWRPAVKRLVGRQPGASLGSGTGASTGLKSAPRASEAREGHREPARSCSGGAHVASGWLIPARRTPGTAIPEGRGRFGPACLHPGHPPSPTPIGPPEGRRPSVWGAGPATARETSSRETAGSLPPPSPCLPTSVIPRTLITLASPRLTDKTTNRGPNSSSASEAAAPVLCPAEKINVPLSRAGYRGPRPLRTKASGPEALLARGEASSE